VGDNVNEALVYGFRDLFTFKTSILACDAVHRGVSTEVSQELTVSVIRVDDVGSEFLRNAGKL